MNTQLLKTISLHLFLKKTLHSNNFSRYNFSNLFSVVNKGSKSYFNMSKTINFSNIDLLPKEYYRLYKIKEGDTWTNIAYKEYNNIKIWWLICKLNNIKNPFTLLTVNKIIKLPSEKLVEQILSIINQ